MADYDFTPNGHGPGVGQGAVHGTGRSADGGPERGARRAARDGLTAGGTVIAVLTYRRPEDIAVALPALLRRPKPMRRAQLPRSS